MKTRSIKASEISQKWYVVDVAGARLGKAAARIAELLIGKRDVNKVDYLPPQNKVVVLNSTKVDIHPRKKEAKKYYRHSGYPGGLKTVEYTKMQATKPNFIIESAVKGMLPNNKRRDVMMTNLFIYPEGEHKHDAQTPEKIEI